jgi:2-succinyl-6-hydroxy-2,4-cyclohexadiene-1-carboxylate synthase
MRITLDDGVTWSVEVHGDGPPVLLLHGFTGSGSTFRRWLGATMDGTRTVAPDLLGHGRSDAPNAPRHAVEHQAADLATLLDRLGAAPATVIGYSFGARVALRFAIDHPGSVARLVLLSPSAGIVDPAARAARVAADARWVDLLRSTSMDAFVDAWAAQSIFASLATAPIDVRTRLRRERVTNHAEGLARSLEGAGQGAMEPLGPHLGQVDVPTLVVSGDLDPVGTERATSVTAAIVNARHIRLSTVGHTPHIEDPDALAAVVRPVLIEPSTPDTTRTP